MKKIPAFAVGALLLSTSLFAGPYWLTAKVMERGFTSQNGQRYPTVTIRVLDPDNSNPLARCDYWVVSIPAKSSVDYSVGNVFQVYQVSNNGFNFFQVRYLDKKSHEKKELISAVRDLGCQY